MASIGSLTASLQLESAAFRRDLGRASAAMKSAAAQQTRALRTVERQARAVTKQLGAFRNAAAALAGVLAVRQFARFAQASIDAGDSLAKQSRQLKISAQAFQQLRIEGDLAGVSTQKLESGIGQLTKRVGEAQAGTGSLVEILKKLNPELLAQVTAAGSTEEAIKLMLAGINDAGTAFEKQALSAAAFGRQAGQAMVLLAESAGQLDERMVKLVTRSDSMLAASERLTDQMTLLKSAFSAGFDTSIVQGFSQSLSASVDSMTEARKIGEEFGRVVGASMRGLINAARFVSENLTAIGAALGAIVAFKAGVLFSGIAIATWRWVVALRAAAGAQVALNTAVKANPFGLLASAIAVAATALIGFKAEAQDLSEAGRQMELNRLLERRAKLTADIARMSASSSGDSRLAGMLEASRAAFLANENAIQRVRGELSKLRPAAKSSSDEFSKNLTPAIVVNTDKVGDSIKTLSEQVGQLELQAKAVKRGESALVDLVRKQKQWNEVAATSVKTGSEEERVLFDLVQHRDELTKAISDERTARDEAADAAKRQLERQRELAKEQRQLMLQPFLNAIEGIQRGFSDALFDMFRGNENRSFVESFTDFMKDAFARTFAEIVTLAARSRIILPVVAAVAGAVGLPASATSTLTSSLGGSGGGLFSGGVPGLPTGNLFSGLTNGINAFGEGLGFAAGNVGAGGTLLGGAGPAGGLANTAAAAGQASGAFTSATLSGVLGAAGIGAFGGGMLASLTGGNQVGGSIGGGLGAAAGFALGGPVGALIGGAAGGFLGGLFGGGGPSDMTQAVTVDLATGQVISAGGLGGKKFSAENQQTARAVAQEFAQMAAAVGGIKKQLEVIIGSRDGLRFRVNGGAVQTAGSVDQLRSMIQGALGDDFARAEILRFIESLKGPGGAQDAIAEVTSQFNAMIATASRLGIATGELVAARDREVQAIKDQIRAPFTQAAGGIVDFLNAQSLSLDAATSPTQRLAEAQRQFGDLLGRVRGGEAGAAGSLVQSAGSLLSIGREQFASTVDFAGLESFVRGSLLNVAEQLTSDQFLDAALRQQTEVLSEGQTEGNALLGKLITEIRFLRQELAA